jgi:hypothetical protein
MHKSGTVGRRVIPHIRIIYLLYIAPFLIPGSCGIDGILKWAPGEPEPSKARASGEPEIWCCGDFILHRIEGTRSARRVVASIFLADLTEMRTQFGTVIWPNFYRCYAPVWVFDYFRATLPFEVGIAKK